MEHKSIFAKTRHAFFVTDKEPDKGPDNERKWKYLGEKGIKEANTKF